MKYNVRINLKSSTPSAKLPKKTENSGSNLNHFFYPPLLHFSLSIVTDGCKFFPKSKSCQILFENLLVYCEKLAKQSKYSKNEEVSIIEKNLAKKNVMIRFKNNVKIAKFIQNGLENIERAGYELPKNIFIVSPATIHRAGGAAAMFKNKPTLDAPIFLPKNILSLSEKKIKQKNKLGIYSTNNGSYYIHHEVGHWLHFQNQPNHGECRQIWQVANKKLINQEVSQMALKMDDGTEFVAEVFAGLIDGKKYGEHVMEIYKELKGPTKST